MKLEKIILTILCTFAIPTLVFAQAATVGSSTDSLRDRQGILNSKEHKIKGDKTVTPPDGGIQQVVQVKKSKFSGHIGASFSYLYRDNALSVNEPIGATIKSDVVQSKFYTALSYGNYKIGPGVFTPIIGASHQTVRHQEKKVMFADYNTQRFYVMGQYRLPNNWTILPSFEYSHNINEITRSEDYKEFFPNISISRNLALSRNDYIQLLYNVGHHYSNIDDFDRIGGRRADQLDNWSHVGSASYNRNLIANIIFTGYGQIIQSYYNKGVNKTRDDRMIIYGAQLSRSFLDFIKVDAFYNNIERDSNINTNDFVNWDAGITVGAVLEF